jgi:2-keto-3-deoxy-L-rhamnonate aldolase RhmA
MNAVKKALLQGHISIGTWIQFGHPGIAEVLANAGFDWIAADMEHSDIGIQEFTGLCRSIYGRGPVPLARVRENDVLAIRQTLDMGALGVIVPLVNTSDDARRAVAAAKYPPAGIRGFAFHRNNDYGAGFDDYVREANDDVLVIVMVETKEAVENIDSILGVEGVDGIFIGPYDMSGSYGMPGKTDDPLIKAAFQKCVGACRKAGKAAGLHVVGVSEPAIHEAIESGFTFLGLGMDNVFLDTAARKTVGIARGLAAGG